MCSKSARSKKLGQMLGRHATSSLPRARCVLSTIPDQRQSGFAGQGQKFLAISTMSASSRRKAGSCHNGRKSGIFSVIRRTWVIRVTH
jgi:hypothetical protein